MSTVKYLLGFDVTDVLNPFTPGIVHSLIIALSAVLIFSLLPRRHLAVALGYVAGLCASALWRHINFTFERAWEDFVYEPFRHLSIFDALFWEPTIDWGYLLILLLYWGLPLILAYAGVWVRIRFLKSKYHESTLQSGGEPGQK